MIYTGEVPLTIERINKYATTMDVPVHYLSNRDVERAFRCYDAVIFIEALGGVVRLICPLLRDKEVDPPVVVADREGRYFIPLIGAHRGANELAEELERALICRMSREDKLRMAAAP